MLSASRAKSNATAKTTIKRCKVLAKNDVHCDERHLQPRAFIGAMPLPSAALGQTQSKPETKVVCRLKRGDYSITSSYSNHTTPSIGRDDFAHHILCSRKKPAIGFPARRDARQRAN